MIELKDYIHLYLGCYCVCQGYEGEHKLTGISYDDTQRQWWCYFEGTEFGHALIEDTAPFLRKINDMTTDEKKELWKLVFKRPFHQNGSIRWIADTNHPERTRCVMSSGVERLGIEMSGDVWYDSDLQLWRCNQHDVTRWLLNKGFDLFGLIEAKLANKKVTDLSTNK